MADYTYLNNVPACRVHKSNAETVKEECNDMLQFYRDRLLSLCASNPHNVDEGNGPVPWDMYITDAFREIWPGIEDNILHKFLASYILEYPNDCVDELEEGQRE